MFLTCVTKLDKREQLRKLLVNNCSIGSDHCLQYSLHTHSIRHITSRSVCVTCIRQDEHDVCLPLGQDMVKD